MSDPVDYKALYLQSEEGRRQAEEGKKQAEQRAKEAEERNQGTTFEEFIYYCHDLFSRRMKVERVESTKGEIPRPTKKHCPLRLQPWRDCDDQQKKILKSVRQYLQPDGMAAPRLFPSLLEIEGLARYFQEPISSERDLEIFERMTVENQVHSIISQLSQIPAARIHFGLQGDVQFTSHTHSLGELTDNRSSLARPDHFCIHRVEDGRKVLLLTAEYKPPHKLSSETLRSGLKPINFYREIVESDTVPIGNAKLTYNAIRLAGSALVQEYHVMIQEGLEYSYLTTGLGNVQLKIPYEDPGTLYFNLSEPVFDADAVNNNAEAEENDKDGPKTEIERVLCLCLMSCQSRTRDQAWRNAAREQLPLWTTGFDHTRSEIPEAELRQNPPGSGYDEARLARSFEGSSPSQFIPSSSPLSSPVAEDHRPSTRSQGGCGPPSDPLREDSSDSDSELPRVDGRKRGFSQVASSSSPTSQRTSSNVGANSPSSQGSQTRTHSNQFCTQRCLLGLQQGGALDANCPNYELHRSKAPSDQHSIRAHDLVSMLKQQLDKNLDENCTPIGRCGAYGAPFKITCASHGYTVLGKGTVSKLWDEVSREAEIYRILQKAQGSAVPVFLGKIDLAMIYFLYGAGEIRHMLLMGWGGETVANIKSNKTIRSAIIQATQAIRELGVVHGDLRLQNILWNTELKKAMIIDFHRCTLQPISKRGFMSNSKKRLRSGEEKKSKRTRLV